MAKILFPIKNGNVTQKFGESADFYLKRFGITGGHNGVDIVSFHGDSIYCPEDGTIVRTYDISHGSVTAGFGIWLVGNPDENNESNIWILWHTMSNLNCIEGQKVKQGDVLAYEGDSGSVYTGGVQVPDSKKGLPPYPGTHLHWGKIKAKRVLESSNQCLANLQGVSYRDSDNYLYEIIDFNNGMRGCINPMDGNVISFNEWIDEKTVQTVQEAIPLIKQITGVDQREAWYQFLLDFLKKLFERS